MRAAPDPVEGRTGFFSSIRGRLVLLTLGLLVPGLLAGALLSYDVLVQARRSEDQQLAETARALTLVVDRELALASTVGRVLATSSAIAAGDFQQFAERARRAIDRPGMWIAVADIEGNPLVTTGEGADAAPLPAPAPADQARLRAGEEVISNLIEVPGSAPLVMIHRPVGPAGAVTHVLTVAMRPSVLARVLADQGLPSDWIGTVLDREFTVVARNRGQGSVGRKATPDLIESIRTTRERVMESVSLDGERTHLAFARSPTYDWTFVVAVPRTERLGPFSRQFGLLIGTGSLLVILGLMLAAAFSRSISRPVEGLAEAAAALGAGRVPEVPAGSFRETTAVARALRDAERSLAARTSELRESENRLRLAIQATGIGTWDVDVVNNTRTWSPEFREIVGLSLDAPADIQTFSDLIHPDDRDRVNARYAAAYTDPAQAHYAADFRIRRPDGGLRWVRTEGRVTFEDGRAIRGVGTILDITEQQRAEGEMRRALTNAERYVRQLQGLAMASLSVSRARSSQIILDALAKAAHAIIGARGAAVTLACPGDPGEAAASSAPDGFDVPPPRADGRDVDACHSGRPAHSPEGDWIAVPLTRRDGQHLGLIQVLDATSGAFTPADEALLVQLAQLGSAALEQAQAEEALRESEERFRSMADGAPALIWMTDAEGHMNFANRYFETLLGLDPAEVVQGAWKRAIHPDDLEAFSAQFMQAFAFRRRFSAVVRVLDAQGEVRWLRSEGAPRMVRTPDGETFVGYVGCDIDVTEAKVATEALEERIEARTGELAEANAALVAQIAERERVEATLRQMQRLEAVGQLTAGVAHDFNNLLTVIIGNIGFLERGAADPAKADPSRTVQRLGQIRMAAERGAKLTAQLLAFSRRQRLDPTPLDLNETVVGMSDLLQSTMSGAIKLETRLAPDLWSALVDPTQIELIILNLAINARDAMRVGGNLTVTTANVTLTEESDQPEEPGPGEYVAISVTDTGTGMPADVRAKVFEPFFTTKEVGKGSGLGLSQVLGFAKQSGGGVALDTEEGIGTTVTVYLPRAAAPADPRPAPAEDANTKSRGKRRPIVLIVDDDHAVREVTTATLEDHGYDVRQAESGEACLDMLGQKGAVDLLLLDFAMPGMNGSEVAKAAKELRGHVPIVFITGYADFGALKDAGDHPVVQKPFRDEDLIDAVKRALGQDNRQTLDSHPGTDRQGPGGPPAHADTARG